MDELGPDEQKWLEVLRRADEPRDADRARVRAAVIAGIGGAAAASSMGAASAQTVAGKAAAVAGAASVARTGLFAVPWKAGIAVLSLVVAGTGIVAFASRAPSGSGVAPSAIAPAPAAIPSLVASPGATATPSAAPSSSPAPDPIDAPSPLVERSARVPPSVAHGTPRTTARAMTSVTRAPAGDVEAELALLTQAQQALKRGDPNGALAPLGRHSREHPQGTLSVEREGLRAIASCEAKRGDGHALAVRFLAANPQSPLVARVRSACSMP